jgi:hypothetical protein
MKKKGKEYCLISSIKAVLHSSPNWTKTHQKKKKNKTKPTTRERERERERQLQVNVLNEPRCKNP